MFKPQEEYLLELLKATLQRSISKRELNREEMDIQQVISVAGQHAVISLLYDTVQELSVFAEVRDRVERETRQIVLQNYRLLFLSRYLIGLLGQYGIQALLLKGVSTAQYYPVPELRKSGDVDLLVAKDVDKKQLFSILKEAGFREKEEQHANHHMEYISPDGVLVEIHTSMTEDFAQKKINRALEELNEGCFQSIQKDVIMGVELPNLSKHYHACELLLHMLHHFLRTGFGLKLLCDWVVLWQQEWSEEEKSSFQELAQKSNIHRFAEIITATCVEYLGMDKKDFPWDYATEEIPVEEFMREILEAEEFGGSDKKRMVMLEGTGPVAYAKEFHHQMHLNFPKAGKCFLLWLFLWLITLVRFLRNNRKIRRTSAGEILKEAHRRSDLIKKLKLF